MLMPELVKLCPVGKCTDVLSRPFSSVSGTKGWDVLSGALFLCCDTRRW